MNSYIYIHRFFLDFHSGSLFFWVHILHSFYLWYSSDRDLETWGKEEEKGKEKRAKTAIFIFLVPI